MMTPAERMATIQAVYDAGSAREAADQIGAVASTLKERGMNLAIWQLRFGRDASLVLALARDDEGVIDLQKVLRAFQDAFDVSEDYMKAQASRIRGVLEENKSLFDAAAALLSIVEIIAGASRIAAL
jgi:hypothetical protein